ncbi:AAA family ATPase [Candidatus Bathyarchaeota archaeon]|nr:AAA family ATPase [Candidatus Bathyarchaeota archaeon]
MGIFLERIEVERYRGFGKYSIEGLSDWSSITGSNSTGKSTLINAISLLGSNRMHEISDIPVYFRPTRVAPREIPIKISYLFRLASSFLDLMSDERIVELLILSYEDYLKKRQETEDDPYKSLLEMELHTIKSKPLREIFIDAFYHTIKTIQAKYPSNPSLYPQFLHSSGHLKSTEDILNDARYLLIDVELSIADGPHYEFSLLDQEKQPIVTDYIFYHWLKNTHSVDPIYFAFGIGAVFIKSVINPSFHHEESIIPSSILALNGSNTIEFIEYYLEHSCDILDKLDDNFKTIFGQGMKIKKPRAGSYSEETRLIIRLGDEDIWFPLEKLSDGMFHVLKILLQLESCHEHDILVIDEPELHLHPGAARSLREVLFSKKSEIQIICATHSPIFIDPSYVDTIVLHRIDEDPEILKSNHIDAALVELGSSGLDALLYDIVIWYEGPSDKLYIENWLQLFSSELKAQMSGIGMTHFGGNENLKHTNPETIKKIARRSIVILDSDKNSENDSLKDWKVSFADDCKRIGIHCWITKRREIENYIPAIVLKKVLNISDDAFSIHPYDNVSKKLKEIGRSVRKCSLARSVTRVMTIEDIKADNEFHNELKEELFDFLNSCAL